MNKLSVYIKLLAFFTLVGLTSRVIAQDSTTLTKKNADRWLRSGEWRNGLRLKVHPSVNKAEFAEQYQKNKPAWDKAFAFLRDSNLTTLKPGKYLIDGDNVYATITEAPSKTFEQSAWESHRKYIDLQYVITGKEKIGVAPISTATVVKPYNETKDLANYTAEGKFYTAEPGTFFLFFPGDAHRPNIKVDGYDVVKKLVIKIKMAE